MALSTVFSPFDFFKPHPLFWYNLALIIGIIIGSNSTSFMSLLIISNCLMIYSLILFYFFIFKKKYNHIFIMTLALSCALGILRYELYTFSYEIFKSSVNEVSGNAQVVDYQKDNGIRTTYMLTLKLLSGHYLFYPVIKLYLNRPISLEVADIIQVNNLSIKKSNNTNFDKYLFKEGIIATAFKPSLDFTIINRPRYSFHRWLHQTRNRIITAFKLNMSKTTYTLFCSIFLGCKSPYTCLLGKIKNQCSYWGIVHYLARSGLHVVLIIFLWALVLKLIPIPGKFKEIFMLFLIIVYFCLTNSSISFIRAFITFILYTVCTLQDFRTHTLHIITITCFLVLLYNPHQLFYLDFQLSFALTFALAWYNEYILQTKNKKIVQTDCY